MALTEQTAFSPAIRPTDRTYLAWAAVAAAYAIAFLQRVSPQSVSLNFMADFSTDAAGVAMLASSYFWGYTLMQIPAGILVDRFGVKRVVLFSMAASSLGSAAFALAPNLLDVLQPETVSRSNKTLKDVLAASRQSLSHLANWGCAMTFASHFAVVTTLSGVWGIPMVAHFFNMSPSAASTPLLAFMIGNAVGSIFLGHMADRAAALDTALIRICLLRMLLIAMLLPPIAHALGFLYVIIVFAVLGLVAGGTVPLVLKCTKKLYTAELIGVGASVNTTAAGIFAGASQPVIGLAMIGISQLAGLGGPERGAGSVGDAGYAALMGILLLMSLPGIAGPLLMRSKLIAR
jgi:MFS family permease